MQAVIRTIMLGFMILGLSARPGLADTPTLPSAPAVTIEFFFDAGCDSCERIEHEILPEVETRYTGLYRLERYDITAMTNYLRLAGYQDRLNRYDNDPVSLVIDGRVMLCGLPEIKARLFNVLDEIVVFSAEPAAPASAPVAATPGSLEARIRTFTAPGVMLNGLADGLNPCAVSILVFFMSLLAVARIRGPKLLLAGGAFCLARYITYLAVGFGLFQALRALSVLHGLRMGIDLAILALLLVLSFLSFRDAWGYRRSGNPDAVMLRLPRPVVLRIHAILRRGPAKPASRPGRTRHGRDGDCAGKRLHGADVRAHTGPARAKREFGGNGHRFICCCII